MLAFELVVQPAQMVAGLVILADLDEGNTWDRAGGLSVSETVEGGDESKRAPSW